ncbi:hypothetical protein PR003_g11236 [Phytophthora rubi]|uniref:Uncharacterized protein n=1 Tax=Phytophthora rubi TaxID=129364 RepID=A0A6A4FH12_9STRA|nr:hypothetical protein PR001_g2342 [Phytophthora rubi]KAE9339011.1 hypothetical protein PR003_g11236 [Phytophthora rubi]
MNRDSSDFVDTIFANLGPSAQTWFRDFKLSLGQDQPATWSLFTTKIRERFRDSDFQQKVMTKLYELRWQGSQQEYTTRFLHLLSQLDEECPEFVKRWLYQQNLRQETSSFVSQNVPETLQDAIELAQRFKDSRPGSSGRKTDAPKPAAKSATAAALKSEGSSHRPHTAKLWCAHCKLSSHSTDVCRRKKAAEAAAAGTSEHPKKRGGSEDNAYCYLSHVGVIGDKTVSAFVDSGASFNAIDPRVAKRLGLKVDQCDKPLKLTIGNNQDVLVPRRVTTIEVQLHGFPVYKTEAFVLPVPEGKHILLGIPWLRDVNPEIDWRNHVIRDRGSAIATNFHQCVREGPARVAGGARQKAVKKAPPSELSHNDVMLYYSKHVHTSKFGPTQVISSRELKKLKLTEGEFCFFVDTASEKVQRQLSTDWEVLRGHPAEELVKKYKDTVFRAELPDTPPTRTVDVEAEIELTDESPVARKQFRLSAEVKEAVREWTREMLANNMIRPSKSPFSSPTFCVRKAVGWRIVHDFRAINARIRVPATPIPRKEDIYDAMANGRIFSAMDLLWGFFQVRLREQDIPYTAFSTPDGLFEYLVTPMGLSSSPSAFNRLI